MAVSDNKTKRIAPELDSIRRTISRSTEQAVIARIGAHGVDAAALVASDYLLGLLTAEIVAALRALYVSGCDVWDGFWIQPGRQAA